MRNPLGKSSVAQILDENRLMGSLHFPETFLVKAWCARNSRIEDGVRFRCHEAVCGARWEFCQRAPPKQASFCAMMPEPTTAASRNALPSHSEKMPSQ
jgi:hypothetical protein